jgi:threonyl-tRNA synthetase
LDFQLPLRFKLKFRSSNAEDPEEKCRPVMIHRAILGSVERMIAILTENFGGDWPLWLSPRQIIVVPVSAANNEYAEKVRQIFHDAGFYADADLGSEKFNKKIRTAEVVTKHNYILVVGNKEQEDGTVNVRKATADKKDKIFPVDEFLTLALKKKESKEISNVIE